MLAPRSRQWLAIGLVGACSLVVAACDPFGTSGRGPNTTTNPYVLPTKQGVDIRSLLTVADNRSADNGYEMVGIPDGLGARQEGDDVVINMNHELRSTQGIFRLHGAKGAFVSRLVLDPETNRIVAGEDFIQPEVQFFNYLTGAVDDTPSPGGTRGDGKVFPPQTVEFNRFCSSSLTDDGQLFNGRSGRGYLGQIYFANEEAGDEGRVFGVTEDGQARQLSRLGLFSWEQTVAAANFTDTTLVMGTEDTATGQLWAYHGRKLAAGSPFARAGLLNGRNNVVRLDDGDLTTVEPTDDAGFRTAYDKGAAVPFTLSDVEWNQSGADQNAEAAAEGLTLNRIEDGAFDPNSPNDFYFLTTEGGRTRTRASAVAVAGCGS